MAGPLHDLVTQASLVVDLTAVGAGAVAFVIRRSSPDGAFWAMLVAVVCAGLLIVVGALAVLA